MMTAENTQGSFPPAVGFWPGDENWGPATSPGSYAAAQGPPVLTNAQVFIFPYVEQQGRWQAFTGANSWDGFWLSGEATPGLYICPADPSFAPSDAWGVPLTCYASNAAALGCYGWTFSGQPQDTFSRHYRATSATIQDGTSNTILFYEKFAVVQGSAAAGTGTPAFLDWCWGSGSGAPFLGQDSTLIGLTPQAGVPPLLADPNRANGGHVGVVLVALFDGSVRPVAPSISPSTWTSAQLPSDGQLLGSDW
jgi:hypothetical protein